MENATRALIMAAVILISVVILSLGVYLFSYFGSYAKDVEAQNRKNQMEQFNSQFLSYQGKELTVYDAITIAGLANDYNTRNGVEKGQLGYITVSTSFGLNEQNVNAFNISEHENDVYEYIDDKPVLKKYKITNNNIVNQETELVELININ